MFSRSVRASRLGNLHHSPRQRRIEIARAKHLQRPQYIIRHASTSSQTATDGRSLLTRTKNLFLGSLILLGLGGGYLYITDTRAAVHRWLVIPSFRTLYDDAEEAHEVGNRVLKALYSFGLHPRERGEKDTVRQDLQIEVFGHVLDNPIGTSAGIDKNADIPSPLLELGPAVVEVGGVTPHPQVGNPRPRVFRVPSQNALINRYGLNSEGAEHVAMQLRQRLRHYTYNNGYGLGADAERIVLDGQAGVPPGSLTPGKLLVVQVAKNKSTPDNDFDAVTADYVDCVQHLGRYADVISVNVSSPNTPGLRSLQQFEPLQHLLKGVVGAAKAVDRSSKPAVMVKVSPDEDSDEAVRAICRAVWSAGVDGIIVGNTTKKRPNPMPDGYVLPDKESAVMLEAGGYSGPQMFGRTLALVKKYRSTLDEALLAGDSGSGSEEQKTQNLTPKVIFATGGITNGQQALEVLNAGASVAMVYTALTYGGVGTITRIKDEMRGEMKRVVEEKRSKQNGSKLRTIKDGEGKGESQQ